MKLLFYLIFISKFLPTNSIISEFRKNYLDNNYTKRSRVQFKTCKISKNAIAGRGLL